MTLKDQIKANMKVTYNKDELAEEAIYKVQRGTGVVITAIFNLDNIGIDVEIDGEWEKITGTVKVQRSEIPNPRKGDLIQNEEGIVFNVLGILKIDSYEAKLNISEKERKKYGSLKSRK